MQQSHGSRPRNHASRRGLTAGEPTPQGLDHLEPHSLFGEQGRELFELPPKSNEDQGPIENDIVAIGGQDRIAVFVIFFLTRILDFEVGGSRECQDETHEGGRRGYWI